MLKLAGNQKISFFFNRNKQFYYIYLEEIENKNSLFCILHEVKARSKKDFVSILTMKKNKLN